MKTQLNKWLQLAKKGRNGSKKEEKRAEKVVLAIIGMANDVEPATTYKGIQKINVIDWLLEE